MPRMTRAKAAEVAEQLHIDEDAVLELPSDDALLDLKASVREPLGDLAPNRTSGGLEEEQNSQLRKSTRGQKGGHKRLENDKDGGASAGHEHEGEVNVPVEDVHREADVTQSAEMDGTTETSVLNTADATEAPVPDGSATSTSQDAIAPNETETQELASSPAKAPKSPLLSATPKAIQKLRTGTPGKRSVSNKENIEPLQNGIGSATPTPTSRPAAAYDALEAAVVVAPTPPNSTARKTTSLSPQREQAEEQSQDPIMALDALEDAVQEIAAQLPEVKPSPQKAKSPRTSTVRSQKAAPQVRATKASAARISLAHSTDKGTSQSTPSLGRPRPCLSLGQSTRSRVASNSSVLKNSSGPSSDEPRTKTETIIPHSKPRPISMSFPTPPPPPKSTKALTKSTFQLPGEAVAAKLKAAREERLKKETTESETQRPAFKARPVPASLRTAPGVRPTNTSRARASLLGQSIGPGSSAAAPAASSGLKRANSVATSSSARPKKTIPRESMTTSMRASIAGSRLGASRLGASTSASSPRAYEPRSSLLASISSTAPAGARVPPGAARGPSGSSSNRGKEVFNRAAAAKEAAEKEKREKEEVAKKARAEAAERSRAKSREWAEKQRVKKMGGVKQVIELEGGEGVQGGVVAQQPGEVVA